MIVLVRITPEPVFVTAIPLGPRTVGVPEVVGVPVLKGVEFNPDPVEGELMPAPVLMVLPDEVGVGDVPMIPVDGGLPIIVPGALGPGAGPPAGAVLTPAPPLVTPLAVPAEVPVGVEAAPTAGAGAFGVAVSAPVVP
jgi:hypothetical protein